MFACGAAAEAGVATAQNYYGVMLRDGRGVPRNPKLAGSKSYERYERYKAATTYDEFLRLGGSRADFVNDRERGHITADGELPVLLTPLASDGCAAVEAHAP